VKNVVPTKMGHKLDQIIDETLPSIDRSVQIAKKDFAERWKTVQDAMQQKGYDLLCFYGNEFERSDGAWLVGFFDPTIESYIVLIPSEGIPIILAGPEGGRVAEEAARRSGADIVLVRDFQIPEEEYRWVLLTEIDEVLNRYLGKGPKRIAIGSSGTTIPYDLVLKLKDKFGINNIFFDQKLLQRIKYEKSDKELYIMQQANKIADAALRGMLAVLAPNLTELQAAGAGDYVVKELGGGRTGFSTIVTSGNRGYTLIGPATNKIIKKGEIVSLGVGPTFNGYNGVIRRTVRVGAKPTPEQRQFIRAVEELYVVVMEAVMVAAKDNLPSNYIDKQGRDYLQKLKLRTIKEGLVSPHETYSFIHNTGCSECQEGYGVVSFCTERPLGNKVALMIDVALTGFNEQGEQMFSVPYAVVENAFWKSGQTVGVYNKLSLNVQHLVGSTEQIEEKLSPYEKEFRMA